MIHICPQTWDSGPAERQLRQAPILEGICDRAAVYRCTLKAGCSWQPALYAWPKTTQMFLFLNAGGYITTERQAFPITEAALFVPAFDREMVTVRAGQDDLVCIRIVSQMNEEDCDQLRKSHMIFPRFRPFSQAWEHTMRSIDDPGSHVRGFVLIENRKLGANNMGLLDSQRPGAAFVAESVLPTYDQFVIALEGAGCILGAGGEESRLQAGDIAFIPRNTPFRFRCGEDGRIHHIWFCLNRAYDI